MSRRYGRFEMGQVLLLARRMIEAGVRFVTANAVSTRRTPAFGVSDLGHPFRSFRLYDSHLLPEFDQTLSALLSDLSDRGLLDDTLVLVMGEFGRTPASTTPTRRRDHWSRAYTASSPAAQSKAASSTANRQRRRRGARLPGPPRRPRRHALRVPRHPPRHDAARPASTPAPHRGGRTGASLVWLM